MNRGLDPASRAIVTLMLALLLSLALALAACGHSDNSSATPTHAALPTWTPGASPSPALTFAADVTGTTDWDQAAGAVATDSISYVDVEVSALACFDSGGDGLRHMHRVGIFERDS